MEHLRARLRTLDAFIADSDFYSDERREERLTVLNEHGELNKKLGELEDQWLELQEKLESMTSEPALAFDPVDS